jgi:class 3 adenylate cyclase
MYHHLGYCISGKLRVEYEDGTEGVIAAGDMFEMPPGHDAWSVGDEPWVGIDFRGARTHARPLAAGGDRILATILFTDIVDSTAHLERLGDAAWRELLAEHNERIAHELDRYRGREIDKTGDGVLALFDSPARAVECAAAIAGGVRALGIEIRAGIHTGEVQLVAGGVRGLAVHIASRILALAGAGEILVSSTTRELAAGSDLTFTSRGRHVLKAIAGDREVFALAT